MSNYYSNLEDKIGFLSFEFSTTTRYGRFDISFTNTAALLIYFDSSNIKSFVLNGLKNSRGDYNVNVINLSGEVQAPNIYGHIPRYDLSLDITEFGVTGQQRVDFFGANTVDDSNKNIWHSPMSIWDGENPTIKIVNNSECPLVIPPNYTTHSGFNMEVSGDNIHYLPTSYSPYSNSFGGTLVFESVFASTQNPLDPTRIYHDIYIDGTIEPISIHTHHNVTNGNVVTSIQKSIGTAVGSAYYDASYRAFGTAQADKGFIKDYSTYASLYDEAKNNCQVTNALIIMLNQSIILRFEDTVTTTSGTTEKYSKYAVMNKDGTHSIQNALSPYPESDDMVIVRFFSGSPSEEDRHNSDDGTSSDEYNSDGTKKGKDSDYDNPSRLGEGSREGSVGIFHEAYRVDDLNIKAIRNKLWTQSYYSVLKVNENPIDNIVSCKRFPFEMESSATQSIRVGNIDLGINGHKLDDGVFVKEFPAIYIYGHFENFLDYAPHTRLGIYLPFIGFTQLDTNSFMGKWLKVKYFVDIVSGSCKAIIYRATSQNASYYPITEREGTMGIDCTLSASTQKQSEIANYTRLGSASMDILSGAIASNPSEVLSGVSGISNNSISNSFQSTSSNAPISNSGYIDCFLIYDYPQTAVVGQIYPSGYLESVGMPNMKTCTLKDLNGFIKCSGDIKLSRPANNENIASMTRAEEMEIKNLLSSGVVL